MSKRTALRLLRIIRNVGIAVGTIAVLTSFGIMAQMYSWPKTPDAFHTMPFNNHGTILYMPAFRGNLLHLSFRFGIPSTFIGVIALFIERRFR